MLQDAGNLGEVLYVETKRGEISTLSGVNGKFLTDKKQNTDLQPMTHGLNFLFLFLPENKSPAGYFVFYIFDFLPKIHPNITDKNVNRVHVFLVDANILRAKIAKGKSAFSRLIFHS